MNFSGQKSQRQLTLCSLRPNRFWIEGSSIGTWKWKCLWKRVCRIFWIFHEQNSCLLKIGEFGSSDVRFFQCQYYKSIVVPISKNPNCLKSQPLISIVLNFAPIEFRVTCKTFDSYLTHSIRLFVMRVSNQAVGRAIFSFFWVKLNTLKLHPL